jgi:hypothetical protein
MALATAAVMVFFAVAYRGQAGEKNTNDNAQNAR